MKKNRRLLYFPLYILGLMFPLVACNIPFFFSQSGEDKSLILEEDQIIMEEGDAYQIVVTSHTQAEITFESFDDEIITVDDNGLVNAIKVGISYVVVKSAGLTAVLDVEVVLPTSKVINNIPRRFLWSDEFNGSSIDRSVWGFQHGITDDYNGQQGGATYWGNSEKQYYTENNAEVKDGNLVITAKREDTTFTFNDRQITMNFTSSRMLTRNKKTFLYGYFETKMKTPTITGMWPAFWMMPEPNSQISTGNEYGGWPVSGEIDIYEARGSQASRVDMTLHFGNPHKYLNESYTFADSTCSEWHVYGLDRRADYIAWYIDGVKRHEVKKENWYCSADEDNANAPFDKPFYFLFNLAVGGNFDGGKMPPEGFTSASMYIDYLRVFE